MAISSDLLRTFISVGTQLSFSRAAKVAGVSQSAISQSIKLLERELGVQLFDRTTKSVQFTNAGRDLFDLSSKVFLTLDDGLAQFQEQVRKSRDSLRIATTDTLNRHFLLPYLKEWQQENPEVGLQITNRPSQVSVNMVKRGEAQLAIVHSYKGIRSSNQIEVIDLKDVQDVFVGGPKYKDAGPFTLKRLLEEQILFLNPGASSRIFLDDLTNHQCGPPFFELGSLDVLIDLLEINMGVSLVPEFMVKEKIREGRLVPLDVRVTVPRRQVVLVRSREVPLTKGASKFIDLLVK